MDCNTRGMEQRMRRRQRRRRGVVVPPPVLGWDTVATIVVVVVVVNIVIHGGDWLCCFRNNSYQEKIKWVGCVVLLLNQNKLSDDMKIKSAGCAWRTLFREVLTLSLLY